MIRRTLNSASLGLLLATVVTGGLQSGIASDITAQDKEDIDNTIVRYKAAVGMNPKNPSNHIRLGEAYMSAGNLELAINEFTTVTSLAPDNTDGYIGLARALIRKGDDAGALKALEDAVVRSPNDAELQYKVGVQYSRLQKNDKAIAAFRQSIKLNADHSKAHRELGMLLGMKGDYNGQIEEEERALKISPDDSIALYYLGTAYMGTNRLAEAAPLLEKSVRLDPKNADGYWSLAGIKAAGNEFKQALTYAQKAVDISPENKRYQNTLQKIKIAADKSK